MISTPRKQTSLFLLMLLTSSLTPTYSQNVDQSSDPNIKCDTCPCETCQLPPPPLPPPSPPPPPPPELCPPPPPPPCPPPPAPKEAPCSSCSTPVVSPPPPRLVYMTNGPGNLYVINQNDPGAYSGQGRVAVSGLSAVVFGWGLLQFLVLF